MAATRALALKVAAVGVGLLLVVGGAVGYVGYSYQQHPPEVTSVDSQWGRVTAEETAVETRVVVENPNSVPIPGVLGIEYAATMNDVVIVAGSRSSIGLSPGRNEIRIPATMENRAIAEWWVTHVNNDESSTMTVEATVQAPGGISQPITASRTQIETDMLEPMRTAEPRTVSLQGEPFVVLEEQSASWGEATMAETPIQFSATVANEHDYALALDGLGYVIRMNDVTVGEGRTTDGVTVRPGETGTIAVDAAIDTRRMADWWATHVRNDESTRMTVAMYGLVERDGELTRVPFDLFETDLRFTTDMLGDGATAVQPVENASDGGPSYEQPTVVDQTREWGVVTDETTEIRSTATVDNPNEGAMNEFVTLTASQRVTINGVEVANGTTDLGTLDPGTNELVTTTALDNAKVPEWWARHVNDGERSTVVVEPRTVADLGFTRIDVGVEGRESSMSTDLLAGLTTDEPQEITASGRTVARVEETRASWGEADATAAPIEVAVTVENTARVPLTVSELQYAITMNDVVTGEGTAPESYTVQPGQTRTVSFTLVVDSQRMDEWWVSHVRNDERTAVAVDASVAVTALGTTERVEVEGLTDSRNVTTDFLGEAE